MGRKKRDRAVGNVGEAKGSVGLCTLSTLSLADLGLQLSRPSRQLYAIQAPVTSLVKVARPKAVLKGQVIPCL